ncbi:MAG: NB-ARC domain-containing protein, partial [Ktedonobacterales bacterium]
AGALRLPAQQRTELAEAARRQRRAEHQRAAHQRGARTASREFGEIPDTAKFHGRQEELRQLTHWIAKEGCRVAAVLGIGGIGKTALMARAVEALRGRFEYVYWCPLYNAPPIAEVLCECIPFLSGQERADLPGDLASRIALLLRALREHRCLLVFDNIESVLADGEQSGQYRAGFEGYGLLLRRISEIKHQSCLALTSRERLQELAELSGTPVRALELRGLTPGDGQSLLAEAGLHGSAEAWAELVARYAGNPLALKLIAGPVCTLFRGDIAAFLRAGVVALGGVHDLCAQQVAGLSALEHALLRWLAIEREPVTLETLRADVVPAPSSRALLEALDALCRRYLIEVRGGLYALQPVILEYLTDQLLVQAGAVLASHAVIKAEAKE